MKREGDRYQKNGANDPATAGKRKGLLLALIVLLLVVAVFLSFRMFRQHDSPVYIDSRRLEEKELPDQDRRGKWLERAYLVSQLYHDVYTPCWEGAYGAIGDAHLFAVAHDSSLLQFHLADHDLRKMCAGTWVDDRAWVCLAEFAWWDVTGRSNFSLVEDARRRYWEARNEGRLSRHEGYWSWYNYPPSSAANGRIFTNSAMNQMATVACWLYEATGDRNYLEDALLVWDGDKQSPGIEKQLYKGQGVWKGKPGIVAFGKELGWEGVEYSSLGRMLFQTTKNPRYKQIVVETVNRVMDPANGWVDPEDFYQIRMDGNGAFVNFLSDAYLTAPDELSDIPLKIEKMLEHVWSNHRGLAVVTLHRESDNAIRNGWNPNGGEQGYGVDEVGTVHAQSEASRAFGCFAYLLMSGGGRHAR